MGVMTKKQNGHLRRKMMRSYKGKWRNPATFDEAMKAAYEDMYTDTKMIREKRKMMKQKMMEHK
jgi:hypothetical protein